MPTDRNLAIESSADMLRSCVILDTETTGLYDAEIVQIAIIDHTGETLLDTLVNPPHPERVLQKRGTGMCAADIHGLTPDKLESAPTWLEIYPRVADVLTDRRVVIYNANYDWPIIRAMCNHYKLPVPNPLSVDCAMQIYAAYCGDWDYYHHNYRWQRLPNGDHSALGDCRAVLRVLREMANARPDMEPANDI